MYSKDSQTFCFHLRLTKNFPIADLEQGLESRSPHHVPSPPLLSIGQDCLSWMGFPGWVRLTEMTPSWRTQTAPPHSYLCTAQDCHMCYLILTKCSEVPAGYKYSINVSYPDDLRERISRDWGSQGREMKGCHKAILNAQQCDLHLFCRRFGGVWRKDWKGKHTQLVRPIMKKSGEVRLMRKQWCEKTIK